MRRVSDTRAHVDGLTYQEFLEAKREYARVYGAPVPPGDVHPIAKDHQRAIVCWAVEGGRRAIFAKFGLGKSLMQLETMRLTIAHAGGVGLIIAPLNVRREFLRDAGMLGIDLTFVRTTAELGATGLYLTNYESVREGKIDASTVTAVSLDEAGVLRGFGGTKTFREFMRLFERTPYRFAATATPTPNEYIEILSYAAFLGIMDVADGKTRFFKRDSEHADNLTIHPHKVEEFWLWVNSWAVFLQRPSELGFDDTGYDLPPVDVRWHMVQSADPHAGTEKDGQHRLIRNDAIGVQQAASAKRSSLPARVAMVKALIDARPDDHVVIWHDLEDERRAIEAAVDTASVYGSQDLDERETVVMNFADGIVPRLAAKPVMLGSGCNLQRHCHWAIFAGVGFKFNDFIQAIHRIYRFLQTGTVVIDIIYASSETEIVAKLQAKWARHDEQMARMSAILKEYGLNPFAAQEKLSRSIGVARRAVAGTRFEAINADSVEETARMPENSVGLIVTSIPFGTQYEYTPSLNDFGHTDDDEHFFRQMDYLSPELLRVLQPGRMLCVHVKDRVRPGGLDGRGFQSVSPFHAETILHYRRHGFVYMGMITVVTDVVRENASTYRLSWSMQCDDGSRMGVGMPEYVLLFRKAPTDATNGYADEPVVKSKDEYSRGRWQSEAHAFWRSSGNRLLTSQELVGQPAEQVFKRYRSFSAGTVYDHEHNVKIAEGMDQARRLPPSFMLLQPHSHHPEVWSDVARMRTANMLQAQKGKEMHLCPLQWDIVDRLINRYSNADDLVYDPFAGLFSVPLRSVGMGRRGLGVELNPRYFDDGVAYLLAAEERATIPSLFDMPMPEMPMPDSGEILALEAASM